MFTSTMASGDCRLRDLDQLVDYREYSGLWNSGFEERWLKPRLRAMGYDHVRFLGGTVCDYDGSFRDRTCELKCAGRPVEYFVYG